MESANNTLAILNIKLKQAMYSHDYKGVQLLVSQGADPNTPNGCGSPLIFWCAEKGRVDLIDFVLEHGADINATNKSGETALHRASFLGKTDIIISLVERGADINKKNKYNSTPLYIAANHNREQAVKTLLNQGADPTITNLNGLTAREKAKQKGFDHIVSLFR